MHTLTGQQLTQLSTGRDLIKAWLILFADDKHPLPEQPFKQWNTNRAQQRLALFGGHGPDHGVTGFMLQQINPARLGQFIRRKPQLNLLIWCLAGLKGHLQQRDKIVTGLLHGHSLNIDRYNLLLSRNRIAAEQSNTQDDSLQVNHDNHIPVPLST